MKHPLPHQCAAPFCRRHRAPGRTLCHRHAKARFRELHPVISAWRGLIDGARQRGREFDLTTADFIEFLENTSYMDHKGRHRLCLHIDRKDRTLGYTRGNIQTLTCTQNTIKGNRERHLETCPF